MKAGPDDGWVIQTATTGLEARRISGGNWLWSVIVMVGLIIWIVSSNSPPRDYGRDFVAQQAFCIEIDKKFVSTRYEWSTVDKLCKPVEVAVKGGVNE